MNQVLCTINIGGFLRQNARDSFVSAAARWGVEYVEITEADTELRHFIDIKHELCNFPQLAGKRVMYIDADAVIRSDCPSPWLWVPEGYFAGVQNDQGFLDQLCQYNQFRAWITMSKFLEQPPRYIGWGINGGMFMFDQAAHVDVFAKAKELYEASKHVGTDEQIGFSIVLLAMGVPFYPLPCLFNCVGPRVYESWPVAPAWITHFAKYAKYRRENYAELLDGVEWKVGAESDKPGLVHSG